MTDDIRLFARVYYYMHITADPSVADRVYVAAEELFVSEDGGKSFEDINWVFSDHMDFWIDPNDSDRIVDGQDHGTAKRTIVVVPWADPNVERKELTFSPDLQDLRRRHAADTCVGEKPTQVGKFWKSIE